MAYCKQCGAYIPDGQEVCLACGYDPDAEKKREAAAQAQAAAYAAQAAETAAREESLRAELERRRAERQANDRTWAENERRRRQMEEEFQRAQEEKERRAESYVHREGNKRVNVNVGDAVNVDVDKESNRVSVNIGGRRYTFGSEDASAAQEEGTRDFTNEIRYAASKTKNRGLAAISYLGILFFVPLLFAQEDEFVQFHAKQGLKLFAYTALASAIGSFFGVGWAATLIGIFLAVKGVIAAVNGKKEQLPLLSRLKWF